MNSTVVFTESICRAMCPKQDSLFVHISQMLYLLDSHQHSPMILSCFTHLRFNSNGTCLERMATKAVETGYQRTLDQMSQMGMGQVAVSSPTKSLGPWNLPSLQPHMGLGLASLEDGPAIELGVTPKKMTAMTHRNHKFSMVLSIGHLQMS